jgi:hypothetical protein
MISTRTVKTMIARTQWGEVEYRTAGKYDVAGVIQYTEKGQLVRRVAAVGTSWDSVERRTKAELRKARPGTLPSDYPYLMEVVHLTEATAPVIRKYFGRHGLTISQVFTQDGGWQDVRYHTGQSLLRKLAKDGVTAITVSRPLGRDRGCQMADFQMTEVVKSMNARKKVQA